MYYDSLSVPAAFEHVQVKLLVDKITQGSACGICSSEEFADGSSSRTFARHHQEGSPSAVLQLNGSATDRTECFCLSVDNGGDCAAVANDPEKPLRTQQLLVDFILTLTKHIMHWAASDSVTVDPNLWQSRVIELNGNNGRRASGRDLGGESATSTVGGFSTRAKGLFSRAAAILLDGVDRTPSSWCSLLKYAQLVLKNSVAILEATLARNMDSDEGDNGGHGCEAAEQARVNRFEQPLIRILLPAVVNGLLPFSHVPVFARRLVRLVTCAGELLDEACYKCPTVREADVSYVAVRNGRMSRRKPQVMCSGNGI